MGRESLCCDKGKLFRKKKKKKILRKKIYNVFFHELQLCFFRRLLNQEGPAPVCPFELWKPFSLVNVLSHSFQCLLFELLTKYIVSAPTSLSVPAVCIYSGARQEEMPKPLLQPGLHYGNVCGFFSPQSLYPAAVNTCLSLYTNFILHHQTCKHTCKPGRESRGNGAKFSVYLHVFVCMTLHFCRCSPRVMAASCEITLKQKLAALAVVQGITLIYSLVYQRDYENPLKWISYGSVFSSQDSSEQAVLVFLLWNGRVSS